jgi:uncharacterized protein (DUF3084 family)
VKNECDELLRASEQFQSKLESVRREREHALGERDEARQECIIAQREKDTAMDQLKDVARVAS